MMMMRKVVSLVMELSSDVFILVVLSNVSLALLLFLHRFLSGW